MTMRLFPLKLYADDIFLVSNRTLLYYDLLLIVTAVFKGQDESLDFIGLLGWKCRIYTLFTPLEDWIGIVRIGRREMNLTSFFFGVYVSIYYLKNQIIYDKL